MSNQTDKKKNLLIIGTGLYRGQKDVNYGKAECLSKRYAGDMTYTLHDPSLVGFELGGFLLIGTYIPRIFRKSKFIQKVYFICRTVYLVMLRHYKNEKYDVLICRNPLLSGMIGVFVSRLIRVPLVVEMNGNYASPIAWHEGSPTRLNKIKHWIAKRIVVFTVSRSDIVRLLYPQQLEGYGRVLSSKRSPVTMHQFVPISQAQPSNDNKGYILLLGSPWYIKGIDLLIKGFNKISDKFPDTTLKVVAWLPGKHEEIIREMAQSNNRISINKPVPREEAQTIIAQCSFLVLPSRTEAMGRVLLEAMSHGKAILGSTADGIPHYVKSYENGLLFKKGDVDDLAEKLQYLLESPQQVKQMGSTGRTWVTTKFSEEAYFDGWCEIIESLTHR